MKDRLNQLVDNCIHPSLREDEFLLGRSRMYLTILLANSFFMLVGAAIFFVFRDVQEFYRAASYVCLAMVVGFAISVAILKFLGSFLEATVVAIFVVISAILYAIILTGGPLNSPFIPLLFFVPIVAVLYLGRVVGLWTTVAILLAITAVLLIQHNGTEFPVMELPLDPKLILITLGIITFLLVLEIVVIFDATNSRLQKELQEEKNRFEHMACHDPLTGLDNRVLFQEKLDEAIFRGNRHNTMFALLYLDLDGFKPVNDTYGHDAGDLILTSVADRLTGTLRKIDTVARLGGDEFAILLEDIDKEEEIRKLVEKICLVIAAPVDYQNHELVVRSSIGAGIFPLDSKDGEELTKIADRAMYEAKSKKPKTDDEKRGTFGQAYFPSTSDFIAYKA